MVIWKLKSCLKCGGDCYIDRDVDGWFQKCLQCGWSKRLNGKPKESDET